MGLADRDNQPFDELALEEHIATALAVEEPRGRELDIVYAIIKRVFKPTVVGAENIPDRPCLFVGNHSLFALDGMVLGPVMQKDLGRFIRPMGDKFLFSVDGIGNYLAKHGAVIGHPEVCSALMKNGSDLLVFPGGAHEAVKSASEMYALQWRERYGFIKLAAKHGYTIMPFGMVGPDEFYGHLIEGQDLPDSMLGSLLKRVGLLTEDTRSDMMPPIPTGLLGTLIPKPQRCYIGFGQPVDLSEYEGKKLGKKKLQTLRAEVAGEIEEQLSELLLLRAQSRDEDSLLRRLLTF
ncbi:MAG: acyltransferase family protein [Proteobacteria bacterium]|nr:acyltransferase family protein [Pseudomonadota bacterium]